MKQFSLEEYLENPQRKVITREGLPVRIICTDKVCDDEGIQKPIIALVNFGDKEIVYPYSSDGISSPLLSNLDLFFAPEKKVYSFKEGDRVLARDSDTFWDFDYFDSYREGSFYPYMCRYAPHEQCIPLNEHTWKLLGTTDEYKEEE